MARNPNAARLLALLVIPVLLVACATAGPENETERAPAVLTFDGDTTIVTLPAAARLGETVTLRFTSFSGGCTRKDTPDAVVSGLHAEVRPYERAPTQSSDLVCPAVLGVEQNVVELRFLEAGRAQVRIVGRAQPGNQPIVVERELAVAP
jgi:hypothetical protein